MTKKKQPIVERLKLVDSADMLNALRTLTYRDSEIFKLWFGLGDGYSYTPIEIGHIFGKTPKTIQRRLKSVLSQVTQTLIDEGVLVLPGEKTNIETSEVLAHIKELSPHLMAYLKAHVDDLPKLHWHVVEALVAEFFASWGFEVRLVGHDPMTAADVYAIQKEDATGMRIRYFVEVKQWKNRVGVEVIDRVAGAVATERSKWGWHVAMIVSAIGGFSDTKKYSRNELKLLGIELRDKDDIVGWLKDYRPSDKGLWLPQRMT